MVDAYVKWKGWGEYDFGKFDVEEALYYASELRTSGIESLNGVAVGEIGYGNGAFAGWARQQGAYWIGSEAIPELQQRAMQAGYSVIPLGAEFSGVCGIEKLDLLLALDVLEHLDAKEIRAFLCDADRVLRPAGLLLFRMPSGDSPFSGAIYYGDSTHKTLLGSSAIRQLASEVGFDVCQIRSPVLPIRGLNGVKRLRRIFVRAIQLSIYAGIRVLIMANRNAVISPNMFVVLRKRAS